LRRAEFCIGLIRGGEIHLAASAIRVDSSGAILAVAPGKKPGRRNRLSSWSRLAGELRVSGGHPRRRRFVADLVDGGRRRLIFHVIGDEYSGPWGDSNI
jgi:hypothetical protein